MGSFAMPAEHFSNAIRPQDKQPQVECIHVELTEPGVAKLLRLGCGEEIHEANDSEAILQMTQLSDRLQMNTVTTMLENRLIQELKAEMCVEMLARGEAGGLRVLQKGCYEMLQKQFQQISHTEAFLELSQETMKSLLEEDELGTGMKEDVFEAVVRWVARGDERMSLLRHIRFGVIEDEYLVEKCISALHGHEMKQLVAEAAMKKGKEGLNWNWDGVERLCDKWLIPRILKGGDFGCGVLKRPHYIAIDSQGRVLVTDGELHQVVVFHRDGAVAQHIGSKGDAPGQFESPSGIAVDQQGNIFVNDLGNHRIQVFTADGVLLRWFHCGQWGLLSQGVAIDMAGCVVAGNRIFRQIQVVDPDGNLVSSFGSMGQAVGELSMPMDVAVDKTDRFVVADCGNHRVQVFNKDGSFALCFGSEGDGPGQFSCAAGVAVHRDGRLVVSDCGNDCIQIFNADGSLARVIGKKGSGVGDFKSPMGVAVDGVGRIFVADSENGRVRVFL